MGFRLHTPVCTEAGRRCQGISVSDTRPKTATWQQNDADGAGIPGSASSPHPVDAIPLPAHGFATLDEIDEMDEIDGAADLHGVPVRELAAIPAVEVITRAAVLLMSASAEKLGLAPDGEPHQDLDEARRLITALAGLVAASQEYLGAHRQPLRDGLTTLQSAFREASSYPDAPGEGPGERLLG